MRFHVVESNLTKPADTDSILFGPRSKFCIIEIQDPIGSIIHNANFDLLAIDKINGDSVRIKNELGSICLPKEKLSQFRLTLNDNFTHKDLYEIQLTEDHYGLVLECNFPRKHTFAFEYNNLDSVLLTGLDKHNLSDSITFHMPNYTGTLYQSEPIKSKLLKHRYLK